MIHYLLCASNCLPYQGHQLQTIIGLQSPRGLTKHHNGKLNTSVHLFSMYDLVFCSLITRFGQTDTISIVFN